MFRNITLHYNIYSVLVLGSEGVIHCDKHPLPFISVSTLFVNMPDFNKEHFISKGPSFTGHVHNAFFTSLFLLWFDFISLTASFFCCQIVPEGDPASSYHHCEHVTHQVFRTHPAIQRGIDLRHGWFQLSH